MEADRRGFDSDCQTARVNLRRQTPRSAIHYHGECGQYENQIATISRPIGLKKTVKHRIAEDEIYYGVSRLKHFKKTRRGNVQMEIAGEAVTGNLNLVFSRGIDPTAKPLGGDIEIAGVQGNPDSTFCIMIFKGHPG